MAQRNVSQKKKKQPEGGGGGGLEFPPFSHALLLRNPKVHGEGAGKGKG